MPRANLAANGCLVAFFGSFCLVGSLKLRLPWTWMQWTKLQTHGMCHSHMQEPFKTLAWRSGEADLRMWMWLRKRCSSEQRPTLLLNLESTLVKESQRRPSKECLSRVMSISMFVSSTALWISCTENLIERAEHWSFIINSFVSPFFPLLIIMLKHKN